MPASGRRRLEQQEPALPALPAPGRRSTRRLLFGGDAQNQGLDSLLDELVEALGEPAWAASEGAVLGEL